MFDFMQFNAIYIYLVFPLFDCIVRRLQHLRRFAAVKLFPSRFECFFLRPREAKSDARNLVKSARVHLLLASFSFNCFAKDVDVPGQRLSTWP